MSQDVYGMLPINRTAALVTSQRDTSDTLTLEQERQNLIGHINSMQAEIDSLPHKSDARYRLGVKRHEAQEKIRIIRGKIKYMNINGKDLAQTIMDIIKEESSSFVWGRWVDKAKKRMVDNKNPLELGEQEG